MNYLPLVYQVVSVSSIIVVALRPICCIGHLRHLPYTNQTKLPLLSRSLIPPNRQDSKNSKKDNSTKNGVAQKFVNGGINKQSTTVVFPYETAGLHLCDCFSEDTYSSCFLTLASLVTLLLVQVTSTGIAPAIILQAYSLVCLVGIFRKRSLKDSGSKIITLSIL